MFQFLKERSNESVCWGVKVILQLELHFKLFLWKLISYFSCHRAGFPISWKSLMMRCWVARYSCLPTTAIHAYHYNHQHTHQQYYTNSEEVEQKKYIQRGVLGFLRTLQLFLLHALGKKLAMRPFLFSVPMDFHWLINKKLIKMDYNFLENINKCKIVNLSANTQIRKTVRTWNNHRSVFVFQVTYFAVFLVT